MASCMECIHFNPCNVHGKIIVEKPTEGNDWGLHNNVENMCQHFTPTADVVEVVRCKNCRHLERDDGLKSGKMCLIRASSGLCNDNDFCSYGERKGDD